MKNNAWRALGKALAIVALYAGVVSLWNINEIFPLNPSEKPGWVTGLRLRLLKADAQECFRTLERATATYRRAEDRPIKAGCGWTDGAELLRSDASYGGNILLSCPAMAALLTWDKTTLEPAAESILHRKLVAVRHAGTYSCRNINGAQEGRCSQHATANAIDVLGFVFEGGLTVSVLNDWGDKGPKGEFLRAARQGACRFFGAVLSPDYNEKHRDHFHLDMGWFDICRYEEKSGLRTRRGLRAKRPRQKSRSRPSWIPAAQNC